jgi:hypothetical protein
MGAGGVKRPDVVAVIGQPPGAHFTSALRLTGAAKASRQASCVPRRWLDEDTGLLSFDRQRLWLLEGEGTNGMHDPPCA